MCRCYSVIILCSIFFFKQKTAYEMRISDWSSDVCSSDLDDHRIALERSGHFFSRCIDVTQIGVAVAAPRRCADCDEHGIGLGDRGGDRKSVVEGKSGSVRVDLGWRRILKKKIKKTDMSYEVANE